MSGPVFEFLLPHFLQFYKEVTIHMGVLMSNFTWFLNLSMLCTMQFMAKVCFASLLIIHGLFCGSYTTY